jgi:hypothetical protein
MLCVTRHGLTACRLRAACADVNLACDDGINHLAGHLPCQTVIKRIEGTAKPVLPHYSASSSLQAVSKAYGQYSMYRLKVYWTCPVSSVCADWVVVLSGPACAPFPKRV